MDGAILMSFITLSALEIVLGIDNLIFIALVAANLPEHQRNRARVIGLSLALIIRIAMLASLSWIMQLTEPLFSVLDTDISVRDLLLIGGGLFLIGKATFEMHADIGGIEEKKEMTRRATLRGAIIQIVLIDLVFSFDSVITAVGIADHLWVMVAAVVVSMIVMIVASNPIGGFLEEHPTFKMLALSFILMIGTMLVAEGMHVHVPKGYVYFAFTFSMFVEVLNTMASKKRKKLREKKNPAA